MSTNTLTFDESPPRRPSIDDLGGGAKVNDEVLPPDPVRNATAEDFNQITKQVEASQRTLQAAVLTVRIGGGGAHSVQQQGCQPSGKSTGTFTLTDNGVGDISITWPANTFPAALADPVASVTGATPAMIAAEKITNGVRVRTKDAANAPVDVPFVVTVF